jgi:DNA-binding winged helix-turn-helix (wHTH) protein
VASFRGHDTCAGQYERDAEPRRHHIVQSLMDQGPRRRFGAYDFDLTTGELRRDGVPIPLQRQPARALACLVARAGTLVLRADLHAAIWGQDVHVDFDRGLNYCIRQLREVLIDDAKAPRYIETIARQGYRFVAPVDVGNLPAAVPAPAVPGRQRLLAAAMVALVGLFVAHAVSGGDARHQQVTVAIARAIHDTVF